MQVHSLQLKHFRCFNDVELLLDSPMMLIGGLNGAGKTSLLEALHYACYLRSFRTHTPRDLIAFGSDNFFIKVALIGDDRYEHDLQIGFSGKKRLIKLDQKALTSYKELTNYYRVVTITEDDLMLIKSGPELRRLFLDQALALDNASYISLLRSYRQILHNRNALLQGAFTHESYRIWTAQLWEQSIIVQNMRTEYLVRLQTVLNGLIERYFDNAYAVSYTYQPKYAQTDSFEKFLTSNARLFDQERSYRRSLFGAHLDDIAIQMSGKTSKTFASRGQQKLSIFLLKIAQLQALQACKGSTILLIDDFMTDFDQKTSLLVLTLLQDLATQLIFTSPAERDFFQDTILARGGKFISLTA